MKTVVTITGIRPDFIRMSALFKELDEQFNHILIHTGQHYDRMLSGVFFDELEIRKPDYNLDIGGADREHFQQQGILSENIIRLLRDENIKPDIILFLGDSNSACAALSLRKEGYIIGHVEAGMRSYDKRMLEELNRTVCDHCSNYLFVYHKDYRDNLVRENIVENVYVVGNTIVEVCKPHIERLLKTKKRNDQIILDIHRPENFKFKKRMQNIIAFANSCIRKFGIPVKMLKFKRTLRYVEQFKIDLGGVQLVDLMSYKQFLDAQHHSLFLISDSGTAQEESALLNTPVIVPRDFTERWQSIKNNCSVMLNVDIADSSKKKVFQYIDDIIHGNVQMCVEWLGDGTTSNEIITILQENL